MNKKDYNKKNVSRNMELLFQTKSKFYEYSLSLVIIPQMSRKFQLLKMKTDLLYYLFFFYEATVMGIVDASPQSTNRSWTCSDVKTWPKNERQVSSTVYIILNPIPKALSDVKYCHSPLRKWNGLADHNSLHPGLTSGFNKLLPRLSPLGSLELGTRLFAIGDKEALYSKTVF